MTTRHDPTPDPPEIAPELPPALAAALRDAVRSLDESHREIVLLRYVHAMDLADIASALGLPLGTVKSRLHRAVAELQAHPALAAYFT